MQLLETWGKDGSNLIVRKLVKSLKTFLIKPLYRS